jgi:two-component system NtrC family response regulator
MKWVISIVHQDRTYEVLGSSETRTVNVRIISATNSDLGELISRGDFREDLLYRLNLIALHVPPLRERPSDIPILTQHFISILAEVYRRPNLNIDTAAMEWLRKLPWFGNIRQLKHTVERAVLMSSKDMLEIDDFTTPAPMNSSVLTENLLPAAGSMTLEEMEQAMISKCLKEFNGNISKVAECLGLSRPALYRRMGKFGIQP